MKTKAKNRKKMQRTAESIVRKEIARLDPELSKTVVASPPTPILLTVTKVANNPYFLDATDAQGQPCRVSVQASNLYLSQDKLLALHSSETPGIMLQVGPRPNYKGEPHYRYRLEQELKKYDK